MRRVMTYLSMTVGFLCLSLIGGCGPKAWVVKADTGADFQRYTVLVAKEFRNGVGETLPATVTEDLPKEIIAHLSECYPGAFAKLDRTGGGSAAELIVEGTITEYHGGSRAGRALLGTGEARLVSDVSFVDGQSGRELTKAKLEMVTRSRGLLLGGLVDVPIGALQSIEGLIVLAGAQIAEAIAEKKGIVKAEKPEPGARKTEGPQRTATGRSC